LIFLTACISIDLQAVFILFVGYFAGFA